jgi:DNA-binding response OmpR family regulator
MPRTLVVEDDPVVQAAVVHALRQLGHATNAVGTAAAALREVTENSPDLVILDLGLPDLDGTQALRMLRMVSRVPVVVATARADEASLVQALNEGADDYIIKPFSSKHLAARVNAVLRRSGFSPGEEAIPEDEIVERGGLRLNVTQRYAALDDARLELSRREFDLLVYMARRPGRVVSRRELLRAVWDEALVANDRTIDVHTSWLRRKLGETAARPRYLHTVRGVGFRFSTPDH